MWVVEYSASQGAFHMVKAKEAIDANRKRFINKPHAQFDWVPIYMGSQDSCERVCQMSEAWLANWGKEARWVQ